MNRRGDLDGAVVACLRSVPGVLGAARLEESDLERLLNLESDAEKRSIFGPGKLVNAGLREVLQRERVYVALTSMEFDWGCRSCLLLKKGERVVGEEVRDPERIRELRQVPTVWFMHDSFVVYKDRMSFPADLTERDCLFEIPSLPADWLVSRELEVRSGSPIYANPSPPCDLHLKAHYFPTHDEQGLGTILLGLTDWRADGGPEPRDSDPRTRSGPPHDTGSESEG